MPNECPIERMGRREDNCPVKVSSTCSSDSEKECINPATRMPYARDLEGKSSPEAEKLSAERSISSIPRADTNEEEVNNNNTATATTGTTWQYPSARMFYNALERKGKAVPVDAIDTMLAVHNYLNEAVWRQVEEKEKFLYPKCTPKLKRFMGRPDDLSPTAWWHVKVRGGETPFDRHDWIVDRCGCEVRYVIDYYSGHPIPGEASFNVDIRPALDSPQACLDRFRLFWRKHFASTNNIDDQG